MNQHPLRSPNALRARRARPRVLFAAAIALGVLAPPRPDSFAEPRSRAERARYWLDRILSGPEPTTWLIDNFHQDLLSDAIENLAATPDEAMDLLADDALRERVERNPDANAWHAVLRVLARIGARRPDVTRAWTLPALGHSLLTLRETAAPVLVSLGDRRRRRRAPCPPSRATSTTADSRRCTRRGSRRSVLRSTVAPRGSSSRARRSIGWAARAASGRRSPIGPAPDRGTRAPTSSRGRRSSRRPPGRSRRRPPGSADGKGPRSPPSTDSSSPPSARRSPTVATRRSARATRSRRPDFEPTPRRRRGAPRRPTPSSRATSRAARPVRRRARAGPRGATRRRRPRRGRDGLPARSGVGLRGGGAHAGGEGRPRARRHARRGRHDRGLRSPQALRIGSLPVARVDAGRHGGVPRGRAARCGARSPRREVGRGRRRIDRATRRAWREERASSNSRVRSRRGRAPRSRGRFGPKPGGCWSTCSPAPPSRGTSWATTSPARPTRPLVVRRPVGSVGGGLASGLLDLGAPGEARFLEGLAGAHRAAFVATLGYSVDRTASPAVVEALLAPVGANTSEADRRAALRAAFDVAAFDSLASFDALATRLASPARADVEFVRRIVSFRAPRSRRPPR